MPSWRIYAKSYHKKKLELIFEAGNGVPSRVESRMSNKLLPAEKMIISMSTQKESQKKYKKIACTMCKNVIDVCKQ